jgi:plastocyanin
MKKILLLIAMGGALVGAEPATTTSTDHLVLISATGVTPADVTIRPGDTVTWKNIDTAKHQVVSVWGTFRSPVLQPGARFTQLFEEESSYFYRVGPSTSTSSMGRVHVLTIRPSIGLTRSRVVYGNPIRVFGSIPTGASDELVTIHITPEGGQTTQRLVTTDEGTYEFTYTPTIRTEFYATWNEATSLRSPTIGVRPLVIFRALNLKRNLFLVRVKAARSYARKFMRVQHRSSSGKWVTTRIVRLNRKSQARFTGKFARGRTKAWAWVRTQPGYEFGFSVIKTIRR